MRGAARIHTGSFVGVLLAALWVVSPYPPNPLSPQAEKEGVDRVVKSPLRTWRGGPRGGGRTRLNSHRAYSIPRWLGLLNSSELYAKRQVFNPSACFILPQLLFIQ